MKEPTPQAWHPKVMHYDVWAEAPFVRVVWLTLVAMADRNGKVDAAPMRLADFANISPGELSMALARLAEIGEIPTPPIGEDGNVRIR